MSSNVYPFAAIVGQESMKLALVLNAIDPLIGGVLLMGHRGTGKSTAVRALAHLLPDIAGVPGCPYQCDPKDEKNACPECTRRRDAGEKLSGVRLAVPLVDLPLGATEDRICGTIDLQRALTAGTKVLEPGLLARANRGFLYIDEVNLLEDHLVDLLLDVAVTGCNKVEREGISIEHPARFVLIGSGNPEEGELRPQLVDRFGLYVEVKTEANPDRRVDIVELRQSFENNPTEFCKKVFAAQQELQGRILQARKKAPSVKISRALLRQIASLCSELNIDGHRGELTIARSARALAALEGRKAVTEEDVRRVAVMSLSHRLRRDPLEETGGGEQIERALNKFIPGSKIDAGKGSGGNGPRANSDRLVSVTSLPLPPTNPQLQSANPAGTRGENPAELLPAPADPDLITRLRDHSRSQSSHESAKRARSTRATNRTGGRTVADYERGRYVSAMNRKMGDARIALDATLRALSGSGFRVPANGGDVLPALDARLLTASIRYKRFSKKSGRLFILAIDASGSMALNRISQAKGAVINLLQRSYINRDRVAIVGFRGVSAEVLLPPCRSMLRARRALDSLAVGGGTPLSAGLRCSLDLVKRAKLEEGEVALLLFTDGQANVAANGNGSLSREHRQLLIEKEILRLGWELRKQRVRTAVIDTQNGFVENGAGRLLAETLQGTYQRLPVKNADVHGIEI